MKTYSFRAECKADVARFFDALPDDLGQFKLSVRPLGVGPDVKVELVTEATFATLRTVMLSVPDAHVMVETLRPCPLVQNSLERWQQ